MTVTDIYFRFIQFSLGLYDGKEFLDGSALKDFDWRAFHDFCNKQTLVGIVFDGVQRLPKGTAPGQGLLMTWFGQSQAVSKRNILLNEASAYIYNKVKAEGYGCCILKGQGNAVMYPNPHSRTPGDVDVWVNAGRADIRALAHSLVKGADGHVDDENYNHVELTLNGVAVELHPSPAVMCNLLFNHRLQKWLRRNVNEQCSNLVPLPDQAGDIAVPTTAFNAVYQLFHLYHHYFYEGVGLRQIVDYYFVVSMLDADSKTRMSEIQRSLKNLGLRKFAGAVMYVLREVLGMSEERMICPKDEVRGRMLLNEILEGGNFGHHDNRYAWGRDDYGDKGFKHGALGHNLLRLYRDLRFMRYYPGEAVAEPFFRVWHFFWRLGNKK